MRVIHAALEALFEDVLPPEVEARYDSDSTLVSYSLAADGGVIVHEPGQIIRPVLALHTEEELERGARLLLLRAARRVRLDQTWDYFAAWDLPLRHSLDIQEPVLGGGLDIERGDTLLSLADPNLLGLVVRKGDLSSVLIFNVAGVVRADPNAPDFVRPPARPLRDVLPSAPLPRTVRRKKMQVEKRAKSLLFKYLAREQKWELRGHGRITVTGQDGRIYRIYAWQGMNVRLVEDDKETKSLCVVPKPEVTSLPVYDLILAQKVLLENDVDSFLKTAVIRVRQVI